MEQCGELIPGNQDAIKKPVTCLVINDPAAALVRLGAGAGTGVFFAGGRGKHIVGIRWYDTAGFTWL